MTHCHTYRTYPCRFLTAQSHALTCSITAKCSNYVPRPDLALEPLPVHCDQKYMYKTMLKWEQNLHILSYHIILLMQCLGVIFLRLPIQHRHSQKRKKLRATGLGQHSRKKKKKRKKQKPKVVSSTSTCIFCKGTKCWMPQIHQHSIKINLMILFLSSRTLQRCTLWMSCLGFIKLNGNHALLQPLPSPSNTES